MNEISAPAVTENPEKAKHPAFIKWAFVIGIAIVANLFTYYVVQVVSAEPEYTAYCDENLTSKLIQTQALCQAEGGLWRADLSGLNPQGGYCDITYECQREFEAAMKVYGRNIFVVFIILGTLLLVASVFLASAEAVALGLSFGGVLSYIIGSIRYWTNMEEWLRVIVLGVALAGLIYFAWKKFKNE